MSRTPWRKEGIRFECECRPLPTHGSALPPMLSVVVFGVVCELADDDPYAPIFWYDPAPAPRRVEGPDQIAAPAPDTAQTRRRFRGQFEYVGAVRQIPSWGAVRQIPSWQRRWEKDRERHQLHRVRRPQRRPARHPPQRPRFQLEFESLTGPLAWRDTGELGPRGPRLSRR